MLNLRSDHSDPAASEAAPRYMTETEYFEVEYEDEMGTDYKVLLEVETLKEDRPGGWHPIENVVKSLTGMHIPNEDLQFFKDCAEEQLNFKIERWEI